jgi:hypothetical protein
MIKPLYKALYVEFSEDAQLISSFGEAGIHSVTHLPIEKLTRFVVYGERTDSILFDGYFYGS